MLVDEERLSATFAVELLNSMSKMSSSFELKSAQTGCILLLSVGRRGEATDDAQNLSNCESKVSRDSYSLSSFFLIGLTPRIKSFVEVNDAAELNLSFIFTELPSRSSG